VTERLEIENFLLIKQANMDVGRVNIIVGPQASGKSVISKLLYFSREFIATQLIDSIENNSSRQELRDNALDKFTEYFPKYTWVNQPFEIRYKTADVGFTIKNQETGKKRCKLSFLLSDTLKSFHLEKKAQYKSFQKNIDKKKKENGDTRFFFNQPFWSFSREHINKDPLIKNHLGQSYFIPASRSFFANVQKSLFSFMSSNANLDPFFKEFGQLYDNAKGIYDSEVFIGEEEKEVKEVRLVAKSLVNKILHGDYKRTKDQDWIENNGKRISISDASSGQQEALPMFVLLSVFPFFGGEEPRNVFFIEEPEAHLFPSAQKTVAKLIVLLHSLKSNSFVLTTHSPYIITALNNMILASEIRHSKNEKRLKKKFDKRFDLKFEDVKAYTMSNGVLKSVLDKKNKLIGPEIIDAVSTEFENEYSELLDILYAPK